MYVSNVSNAGDVYIYIFERSSMIKIELNESTKKNSWLSLQDTSHWQAANSEECDVVLCS